MALYGDMGNINAVSLPRLQAEAEVGMYDMIFHVGDFAYNMEDVNTFGCLFFQSVIFLSSRTMVNAGMSSCDKSNLWQLTSLT